ncbi:glycoprotein-N-acetylgalactosamine 3-beta-galactosyltransferase 1-like [Daphnia pulex]|uniref:glycoprotein-N-acetylgalactosamine 3-beta-galactosyltransferase 1-like n=1 Tax=Daphnia pulex TaxID=6669 RepID=UPI001EE00403|nr:glycoprotein-N-acetylgalactosamine 3-beta-galactosyltransferase 1-like [Daphnia pulex]
MIFCRRQSCLSLLTGAIIGCCLIAFVNQFLHLLLHQNTNVVSATKTVKNQSTKNVIRSFVDKIVIDDKGKSLYDRVRILCWVMTTPANHDTKARAVKETWGPRCNVLLFISTEDDPKLPTVKFEVKSGRDGLWGKTREAFRYAWDRYQDEVDWFLKADDDTYIIVENLRYFLSGFNTSKPMWFGHKFKALVKNGYFSGGAGYALSREATKRFVKEAYFNETICRKDQGGAEDAEMGTCMQNLNVSTMDTRDSQGRGRFFPFNPDSHYNPGDIHAGDYWYWDYIYYPPTQGRNCCSDSAISFHYVDPNFMRMLDLFFYQIRPYGVVDQRPAVPEPPPDVELKATRWFAPPKPTPLPPPTTTTTIKPKEKEVKAPDDNNKNNITVSSNDTKKN